MIPSRAASAIPDASFLVEEWERAAAGRSEPERPPVPSTAIGAWLCVGYLVALAWGGRWLCGC